MRTIGCAILAASIALPCAAAAREDTPAETKRVVRAWSARLNAYDTGPVS
jgi:hypothetical protein